MLPSRGICMEVLQEKLSVLKWQNRPPKARTNELLFMLQSHMSQSWVSLLHSNNTARGEWGCGLAPRGPGVDVFLTQIVTLWHVWYPLHLIKVHKIPRCIAGWHVKPYMMMYNTPFGWGAQPSLQCLWPVLSCHVPHASYSDNFKLGFEKSDVWLSLSTKPTFLGHVAEMWNSLTGVFQKLNQTIKVALI